MTIFSDAKNRVIDEKYIQELNDDGIDDGSDMIEKAKQRNAKAMYTIGSIYADREEQRKAILWLGTSSALGYHESQIILGDLFLKTDSRTSFRWYKLAKDNGLKQALSRLGDCYVQRNDYKNAVEQYLEAANHGDPYSQNCLGELCVRGIIGQNLPSALEWFLATAKQNYDKAQFNVATSYELGQGVALDWYKAIYWYEQSKMGGYEPASSKVKELNTKGCFYIPQGKY